MNTTDVNILFWDNPENFKREDTQDNLGIFDGKSSFYKSVCQFYNENEIDSALNDVKDNEFVYILCHIDIGKQFKGYKKFQSLLSKYPHWKNSVKYVSSSPEAHQQFFDQQRLKESILTYLDTKRELESMTNIPTKRELLQLNNTEQSVAKNHMELIEGKIYTTKIAEGIKKFNAEHSEKKTAFIMTSFSSNHTTIINKIKDILEKNGIEGLVATDKKYDSDLFPNIQVYMHCCDFGVGVFTKIDNTKEFNPNVSLEVGYMMGLGKEVCYLKEQQCSMNTDLFSKLYESFDAFNPDSIQPVLKKWLEDKSIIKKEK